MTIRKLYDTLAAALPASLSCEWDNDGLQVSPDENAEVTKVLVALDATLTAVEEAKKRGCNVILTHHPLIFTPLAEVTPSAPVEKRVIACLQSGISVMSFHTRLDKAAGGVNDRLASLLGLADALPFADGVGRVGTLTKETSLSPFAEEVQKALAAEAVETVDAGIPARRVAVIGGAGGDFLREAKEAGADTLVTGEVKHHIYYEAREMGLNLIVAGHFFTEAPVCEVLAGRIGQIGLPCEIFSDIPYEVLK